MPRIGQNANVDAWSQYDKQTERNDGADGAPGAGVDHGASALSNLKEAGQNALDTFDPTNHLRETWSHAGRDFEGRRNPEATGLQEIAQGMNTIFAVLMLPSALMHEVADVFTGPVKMVKNLGDAAVHGATAGISKMINDD